VLAGPAGSGKSTLCDRIVHEVPGFSRVITTTTRAPRPGEVNGVHYHFDPEQFDAKIAADEFLEWAWVHGDRRYGTLKASILDPSRAAGASRSISTSRVWPACDRRRSTRSCSSAHGDDFHHARP